ncbi:MAG: UDP-N-acetylglucosamine 3-dehydrogenase [Solirubrobacteraceae bacterium]|nr:UDP-N-acetylglucosamine 3-dehydrogenase [Solirubrobacteraceae bacterium]
MSRAELRVGLIGVGQMGGFHLETWEKIPAGRVVAVADPSETMARGRIGRRPIDWHADWRALLERSDIDAVCIAAPSEMHAHIGLAALDARKHVMVEKPIATRLEDGLRMAATARRVGRKLMVGHVERFNPAVGKLQSLIDEGRIGRVFRAHATRVGPLPARIRDAGVTIDLATHDLDIMQFVLGRDITRVYAEGTRFSHPTQEDMISCLLRFGDDGPFGLLDVNWLTPEKKRELTVIGEGGMLSASYITQDVWFTESTEASTGWEELARVRGDAEGAAVRFALRKVEPLRAELEAFADCILDDTPEPVTAYEGCRALIAALAVRDSAFHSRPITLLGMPNAPTLTLAA